MSDADYRLSEQAAASDPTSSLSQDLERRREAQKAFHDANFQQSVRRSLLARNRRRAYLVGETVYYWREKGENKDDTGLDVYHWHGPGVVCATEPLANLDLSLLDRCYWVVHGSALFWCTHEQRPETIDERDNHMPAPNLDTIRGMLCPVRFVDLKGKERPYVHSPPPPAQPQQVYEPTEAEQRAAAHAARQHHQATAPIPIVPEDTPTVDETAPKLSVAATKETTSRQPLVSCCVFSLT